jgi:hypothetical protein
MTPEELLSLTPEQRVDLPAVDVSGCIDCSDCTGCTDCIDCTDCTRCTDCTDCAGIQNGCELRYIAWGVQLTKEQWKLLQSQCR